MTGCEIDEQAALLARVNARLNGVADRFRSLRSDLYAELPEGEFDVIVANPPMVAIPSRIPYPFVGNGGPDGLAVILRIIEGLPGRLAPSGVARTLGVAAAGDEFPLALDTLRTSARRHDLRIRLTLTAEQDVGSDSNWNRAIAAASLGFEGLPITQSCLEVRARQVAQGYADMGVRKVVFFFMAIIGESPGSVNILDTRAECPRVNSGWYVA